MKNISVALVDDDSLIIRLLEEFLLTQSGINICMTAESGKDFLEKLVNQTEKPDVLILDLNMKNKNGIEISSVLTAEYPSIKIIVMSSYYNKSFIGFMVKTGVAGFIPKGVQPLELVKIIKEVNSNGFYFLPEQIEILRNQISHKSPPPILISKEKLSKREIEVLKLICQELTNDEIAKKLFLSKRTIESHRQRILEKIGSKNTAGLVVYAIANKIHTLPEHFLTV